MRELISGLIRRGREHRGGIDSQTLARCQGRKTGVAAIEFNVRVFVKSGRASRTPKIADPNAAAFVTHLKVSDMKYRQRDVGEISQARVVKSHRRVRR